MVVHIGTARAIDCIGVRYKVVGVLLCNSMQRVRSVDVTFIIRIDSDFIRNKNCADFHCTFLDGSLIQFTGYFSMIEDAMNIRYKTFFLSETFAISVDGLRCDIALCKCFSNSLFHCDCHNAHQIIWLNAFCDYLVLGPMFVTKSDNKWFFEQYRSLFLIQTLLLFSLQECPHKAKYM